MFQKNIDLNINVVVISVNTYCQTSIQQHIFTKVHVKYILSTLLIDLAYI